MTSLAFFVWAETETIDINVVSQQRRTANDDRGRYYPDNRRSSVLYLMACVGWKTK